MSINRGMDKEDVVHIYNGILLSHWKEWNNDICSNTDGPWNCHSEWSQSDKEGEISYYVLDMWNLKINNTNELTNRLMDLREQTYGWEEGRGEGTVKEFWTDMYTLLYLKWITNKDILYGTWNSAQCYVVAYMYSMSPLAIHLKLSWHC